MMARSSPPNASCTCLSSRRLTPRSEEHTSELQSQSNLVCRLLLEKKQTPEDAAKSAIFFAGRHTLSTEFSNACGTPASLRFRLASPALYHRRTRHSHNTVRRILLF